MDYWCFLDETILTMSMEEDYTEEFCLYLAFLRCKYSIHLLQFPLRYSQHIKGKLRCFTANIKLDPQHIFYTIYKCFNYWGWWYSGLAFGHANLGSQVRSPDIRWSLHYLISPPWSKTTQIATILSSDGTYNIYMHLRL